MSVFQAPLAFLVTEFHILLAYEHKVRGICILNQQTVFEYGVDPGEGKIKGLARDPIRGVYYAYTDYAIHRFQGRNSIEIFVGPESGPEPGTRHVWSFETCPNF